MNKFMYFPNVCGFTMWYDLKRENKEIHHQTLLNILKNTDWLEDVTEVFFDDLQFVETAPGFLIENNKVYVFNDTIEIRANIHFHNLVKRINTLLSRPLVFKFECFNNLNEIEWYVDDDNGSEMVSKK